VGRRWSAVADRYDAAAVGFCLEWRFHAIISRPDPRPGRDPVAVWQCRHTDHETYHEAIRCADRRIAAAERAGVSPAELPDEAASVPPPASEAYLIQFSWSDADSSGTGSVVVAGSSAEEAERRWREADSAEWPKYEVLSAEPLGDQVLLRYDE
jgi:hypothetical protein